MTDVPDARDRGVVGARPADDREVDPAHRVGEALDGVVAEPEEVGRSPRGGRACRPTPRRSSSAIDALDEDRVEPPAPASARSSSAREPEVAAHALDVVVHPRLAVGQDLDVDRGRRAGRDDRRGDVLDAVTVEHVEEHVRPSSSPTRLTQPERHPERAPVPRHVEDAAARQDRPVGQVAVEAERAAGAGSCRRLAAVTARRAASARPSRARGTGRSGPRRPCSSARTPRPTGARSPRRGTTRSGRAGCVISAGRGPGRRPGSGT